MKHCDKCGFTLENGAILCPNCGARSSGLPTAGQNYKRTSRPRQLRQLIFALLIAVPLIPCVFFHDRPYFVMITANLALLFAIPVLIDALRQVRNGTCSYSAGWAIILLISEIILAIILIILVGSQLKSLWEYQQLEDQIIKCY